MPSVGRGVRDDRVAVLRGAEVGAERHVDHVDVVGGVAVAVRVGGHVDGAPDEVGAARAAEDAVGVELAPAGAMPGPIFIASNGVLVL